MTKPTPEKNTKFNYLLNTVERVALEKWPSEHGYAEARIKLISYVHSLERLFDRCLDCYGQLLPSIQKLVDEVPHD